MEKILVIEDSSKSNFGGGQKVTIDFINTMLGINKEIVVIDHAKGIETEFKNKIKQKHITLFEVSSYGKIENKPLSSYSFSKLEVFYYPIYLVYSYYQFFLNKQLRQIIEKDTIIYCATKKALFLGWLISSSSNKIIFHAHNLNKKNVFSFLFNIILKMKNVYIISVSNAVNTSYNLAKIKTIYNGVHLGNELLVKNKSGYSKHVAFVGSLITWKGIDVFLESICFQGYDIEYHVYGSGTLFNFLSKKWEKEERIHFKGFKKEMNSYYKSQIDILCLPSLDSEACPMTIIEAFSYGIPVITTNIGGQAELVTNDSGILVKVNSSKEISDAIDTISSNYKYYSDNALSRFKIFSIDEFNKSMIDFIINIK